MSIIPPLDDLLDAWTGQGWLRPLDRAFARFLRELTPDIEEAVVLAATLCSHQFGRGHICLDLEATLEDPDGTLSLPPEGEAGEALPPKPSELPQLRDMELSAWQQTLRSCPIVAGPGPGNAPLILAGHRLYLRRNWQDEHAVAMAISARLAQALPCPENLRDLLDQLFTSQDRPDWQRLACALASRGAFTVITGGPGTGKTTTVVRLLALLQAAARAQGRVLTVALAAPTGKAAARLTESIGGAIQNLPEPLRNDIPSKVTTLHRLLGSRPDTRHFRHNPENPLPHELVVVDEASMIDLEMMARLLGALRPQTRLVLLGDKDQLASVEAGAVLGDLCGQADQGLYHAETIAWAKTHSGDDLTPWAGTGNALAQQTAMLRHSRRFRTDSGIGALAAAVNQGNAAAVHACWSNAYGDLQRLQVDTPGDETLAHLLLNGQGAHDGYSHYLSVLETQRPKSNDGEAQLAWAKAVCAAFGQFQVLCALREGDWGVRGLNLRISTLLHRQGLISANTGWYEGRPVLMTHNDYGLGLMNGDIGLTLNMMGGDGQHRLRVVFPQPGGELKQVLPSRLTDVETVFAMTVHKSQGSEFNHAVLVLPDRQSPVLTRELVYTGITRARERFTLVCSRADVLATAIERRTRRSSGLKDLLS